MAGWKRTGKKLPGELTLGQTGELNKQSKRNQIYTSIPIPTNPLSGASRKYPHLIPNTHLLTISSFMRLMALS